MHDNGDKKADADGVVRTREHRLRSRFYVRFRPPNRRLRRARPTADLRREIMFPVVMQVLWISGFPERSPCGLGYPRFGLH